MPSRVAGPWTWGELGKTVEAVTLGLEDGRGEGEATGLAASAVFGEGLGEGLGDRNFELHSPNLAWQPALQKAKPVPQNPAAEQHMPVAQRVRPAVVPQRGRPPTIAVTRQEWAAVKCMVWWEGS